MSRRRGSLSVQLKIVSLTLAILSPLFFYSLAWIAGVTVLFFLLSCWLMRRRLIV